MTLGPEFLRVPLAHRGLHDVSCGIIENSPAAIERAVEQGYGIEVDVQRSADGDAMVFHDYTLDRVTDQTGAVAELATNDLLNIGLSHSSDTIPTLAQVLTLVKGRVPLLIEIKDQDGALGDNVGILEAAVARDLHAYDGPVAVMSFNPHSVAAFQSSSPGIACGLVTDPMAGKDWPDVSKARRAELAHIPDAERLKAAFISHNVHDLNSNAVARLKSKGLAVLCWTVRSPEVEADARKIARAVAA